MQDHEEHNSWLEEQAARVPLTARRWLTGSSAATERERAICCARRSKATGPGCSRTRARSRRHGGDRPRRARGLHARQVGRDRQRPRGHHSIRRGERPTGIARRDARGQGRSRRLRARSQSTATPEGSLAVDHPASPVNQRLNHNALAEDLVGRVSVRSPRGYSARLESGLEWLQSDTEGRTVMEANTLASRVEAYGTLDRIQRRGRCRDRLRRSSPGPRHVRSAARLGEHGPQPRRGRLHRRQCAGTSPRDRQPARRPHVAHRAGSTPRLRSPTRTCEKCASTSPTRRSMVGRPAWSAWHARRPNAQRPRCCRRERGCRRPQRCAKRPADAARHRARSGRRRRAALRTSGGRPVDESRTVGTQPRSTCSGLLASGFFPAGFGEKRFVLFNLVAKVGAERAT